MSTVEYSDVSTNRMRSAPARLYSESGAVAYPEYRRMDGLCECGCGEPAPISSVSHRAKGYVRGKPRRFILEHHARTLKATERYVVEQRGYTSPCWIWQGSLGSAGYGLVSVHHKTMGAHRWMYERYVGPIPAGLQIDHLCRVPACVNPAHMEPVTPRENTLRSPTAFSAVNARKTRCPQGHPYDEANTVRRRRGRRCRACEAAYEQRRRAVRAFRALTDEPTDG